MRIQRHLNWHRATATAVWLVAGCATVPHSESDEVGRQMRALRERQEVLERKVGILEARLATSPAPKRTSEAPRTAPPGSSAVTLPGHLATVRLGPEAAKPSRVSTHIALREPSAEAVEEMFSDDGAGDSALFETAQGEDQAPVDRALESLRTGDVENGVRQLEDFADRNPRHSEAARALHTAGVAMQNYGEPGMAMLYLQRVSDDYPTSPLAPDALMRMASCQLKLKKPSVARELLARIIQRYRGTEPARIAETELKELERQAAAVRAEGPAQAAE